MSDTRQNIEQDPLNPVDHLDAGYEETPDTEFHIPPCGIEDADLALKNLFFEDIGFVTKTNVGPNKDITLKKPLIIFATGERWALVKRLKPPRDSNQALLLPAISIRRTSFEQTREDVTGRGINQSTGKLTIKRRLSDYDRDYQNLINKFALQNMNLQGLDGSGKLSYQELKHSADKKAGGLLQNSTKNNVWEIISIPQPQFFTTTYDIVFWTQYTVHMNQLLEKFVSSYLPQEKAFRLKSDKGYWFMAYVEDSFATQDNFEDFKDSERIIRYNMTIKVKGFILAPQGDSDKVPVRRWISNPGIHFDVSTLDSGQEFTKEGTVEKHSQQEQDNKFVLSDVNNEDLQTRQTKTYNERHRSTKIVTGKNQYVKILESNEKKGETIYRASSPKALADFFNK